ncbi:MAG TPA: hypothetical protein VI112_01145 [Bacteroidia bacterium]
MQGPFDNWEAIAIIVSIFISFFFLIREKKYDRRQEQYRKVRVAISNLLHIWSELSAFQVFLRGKDPSDELLLEVPYFAKRHFKVDHDKIANLKKSYDESLKHLKGIDPLLYVSLADNLEPFNRTITELLVPILNDKGLSFKRKNEFLLPLIDETIGDLEKEILAIAKHLKYYERRKIYSIIEKHRKSLNEARKLILPEFILEMLNNRLKMKEKFNSEELNDFYNNPTIIWASKKFFKTSTASEKFRRLTPLDYLKMLYSFRKVGNKLLINSSFDISAFDFFKEFTISKKEEQLHLVNNKAFYKLVIGFINKMNGSVSYEAKRKIARYNMGWDSIRAEIEVYKLQIQMKETIDELLQGTKAE